VTLRLATRAGLALLLLLGLAFGASAAGLTDATMRGKRIYMEGKGRGKITASLPGAGVRAPGSGFPCVNCHLAGGAGQSEGGVRSADIAWFTLTKEYGGPRPSGRTHPPYTDETVRKAITGGLDPAGNVLASAHPRFGMDREDLDDLVAYMKVMDSEPVPGVTDNAVRVGILYPSKGPLAEAAGEVRALLSGIFREANGTGGVFTRRLELVEIPFDPSVPGGDLAAGRGAVEGEDLFCFLANVGVPADGEAARFLASARVPVLVPLLSAPEGGYGADRYTFHVLASIKDQARVMVDFLAGSLKSPANRIGLLYATDPSGGKGAEGAREQAKRHGLPVAAEVPFAPGALDATGAEARMRREKVDAVLYFGGPADALAYARQASQAVDGGLFLAPAPMVGDALLAAPKGFLRRVLLAAPMPPPDAGARQTAEFLGIRDKYSPGDRHRSFQLLAYTGTLLLTEGLKRSGRVLTREKFVGSIGTVWQLQTGVTPPLTYDANRRVGAMGAAIVRVDPDTGRFVPAAGWREPQ
jgi:ABC-type branched-subunit amino acid transport system substrate-binding protein